MSSTGEAVGGVVGAIVGFYTAGNPYYGAVQGAALGAGIGSAIDPPPGPDMRGPTLADPTFNSNAYGTPLQRTWASVAITGSVIYLENNEYKAEEETEQVGGKGGGGEGTMTTTSYFATFAVALGEAQPGTTPRRIWAGGKLIHSLGGLDDSDSEAEQTSVETLVTAINSPYRWRYYDGTQTEPDPRIESVMGEGETPAYTGTAYIVFYDFPLAEFGNGLAAAPIKVELGQPAGQELTAFQWLMTNVPAPADSWYRFFGFEPAGMWVNNGTLHDFDEPSATNPRYYRCLYAWNAEEKLDFYLDAIGSKPGNLSYPSNPEPGQARASWPIPTLTEGLADSYQVQVEEGPDEPDTYRLRVGGVEYDHPDEWPNIQYENNVWNNGFVWDVDGHAYLLYRGWDNVSDNGSGDHYVMTVNGNHSRQVPTTSLSVGQGYVAWLESVDAGAGEYQVVLLDNDLQPADTVAVTLPGSSYNMLRSNLWRQGGQLMMGIRSPGPPSAIVVLNLTQGEIAYSFPADDTDAWDAVWFAVAWNGVVRVVKAGADPAPSYWLAYANALEYILAAPPVERLTQPLDEVVADICARAGLEAPQLELSALEDDTVAGYRVNAPGSFRAALGPLQVAYRFDLVEDGYVIKAVKRADQSSVAEIPYSALDARPAGNVAGVAVGRQRESDERLPSRYTVQYLDYNREYGTNAQYADYPSSAVNERSEELPVVLDASEAAQTAQVLIQAAWTERNAFSLALPQPYLTLAAGRKLLPTDLLDVEVAPDQWATVRAAAIEYEADQRLALNARTARASSYTSSATGQDADPPSEGLPYVGQLSFTVLDLPMIADAFDTPGYAVAGWAAGNWRQAVVLVSDDEGGTYRRLGQLSSSATVCRAVNALTDRDYFVLERDQVIECEPLAGEFFSATQAELFNGRNLCAYGRPGRWEIIRFLEADLNSEGRWDLTGILGGLFGTEWAGELHQARDYVVLLDGPGIALIDAGLPAVGQTHYIKAVQVGQDEQDTDPVEMGYDGVNLLPLDGVHAQGERDSNDDWVISWDPRTRYPISIWTTGNAPPDEVPVAYEVVILDGETEVRVLETASPSATYTAAQQTADWGSVRSSLSVAIYQISNRVGRGRPLTANLSD